MDNREEVKKKSTRREIAADESFHLMNRLFYWLPRLCIIIDDPHGIPKAVVITMSIL